jgi:hypothetical protein
MSDELRGRLSGLVCEISSPRGDTSWEQQMPYCQDGQAGSSSPQPLTVLRSRRERSKVGTHLDTFARTFQLN